MSKRVPTYRCHKATGQAVVTIKGKDHYFDKFGTQNSHEKYAELISQWQAQQTSTLRDVKVRELTVFYWKHAQTYYVKNGEPSGYLHVVRNALKYLNEECRDLSACRHCNPNTVARSSLAGIGRRKQRLFQIGFDELLQMACPEGPMATVRRLP